MKCGDARPPVLDLFLHAFAFLSTCTSSSPPRSHPTSFHRVRVLRWSACRRCAFHPRAHAFLSRVACLRHASHLLRVSPAPTRLPFPPFMLVPALRRAITSAVQAAVRVLSIANSSLGCVGSSRRRLPPTRPIQGAAARELSSLRCLAPCAPSVPLLLPFSCSPLSDPAHFLCFPFPGAPSRLRQLYA